MSSETCGNPGCNEPGKLKCTGCESIYYCSAACQKKHWGDHKTQCKKTKAVSPTPASSSSSSSNIPPNTSAVNEELLNKLNVLRQDIQKAFSIGNFPLAIAKTDEALVLARELPKNIGLSEVIQLTLNQSTAFLQVNKPKDAENASKKAILNAEIGVTERPNNPQAIEVLAIALTTHTISLVANGKLDEALESSTRSLKLAESIYPKNDIRLQKALRTLAIVYDKKGESSEAEKTFFRAYTIVSIHIGPQTGEAQLLIDDITNLLIRKNDLEAAEKYARNNYKSITEKNVTDEKEKLILADSSSRLASILVKRSQFDEAEALVTEALKLRETTTMKNVNPLGVAYSLAQLAGIKETLNKLDEDIEGMLMKALDIFSRFKGQHSAEVVNTLAQLRSVKNKKSAISGESNTDDNLEYKILHESKLPKKNASSNGSPISAEEQTLLDQFPDSNPDAIGRMVLANRFFEKGSFLSADILINKAHQLFIEQFGPDHQNTIAAKQNLTAVRNNRINQLWMQIVAEEVLKLEEKQNSSGEILLFLFYTFIFNILFNLSR